MNRPVAAALIVCIFACGVGYLKDRRALSEVRHIVSELESQVGSLVVDNESQMHVVVSENKGTRSIVWRVFLPLNPSWEFRLNSVAGGGGSSRTSANTSKECLVRFGLDMEPKLPTIFFMTEDSVNLTSLSREIAEFLVTHWDELEISVAGSDEQQSISIERVIDLIVVRVPESVLKNAADELSPSLIKRLEKDSLLHIEFGDPKALAAAARARQKERMETSDG